MVRSDEAILYSCPVEGNNIVVVTKDVLNIEVGSIISSTQAEGIFHKVTNILNLGKVTRPYELFLLYFLYSMKYRV